MLRLSAAGIAAGAAFLHATAEDEKVKPGAGPIKTRMFWTWDHSTEWALNRPGAQTWGALNP